MRILLFTGKGGVGKTTVAAATAVHSAAAGRRTLVLSTDPAHSLADAFGLYLSDEPREISPNLAAQQLDARIRLEEGWDGIRDYLVDVLDWAGAGSLEAEELAVIPGLDEVFSLADIKAHADSGHWDTLVVDCAPTAETIRLLSLPEILSWYMDRIFPAQRRITKAVRPLLNRATNLPVAPDGVFATARRFYEGLDGVKELLTDPEVTSARLVVNPERMVVAEARRTFTYLCLFGYQVDAVIANRLLPDAVTDPWFASWKQIQKEHMVGIEEAFSPVPVLQAPLFPDEPIGVERLGELGEALYPDGDADARLHRDQPMTVRPIEDRADDGFILSLLLPFADKDDIELARRDGELLLAVGPYRRAVTLPDSLRRREVTGARMVGTHLEVEFATA